MLNVVVTATGPLLSLEEAKLHLKVETPDEDQLIESYADAAVLSCLAACSRALVPQGAEPVFKAAALLMLGDLFHNRQAVVQGQAFAVSPTVDALLYPHKLIRV